MSLPVLVVLVVIGIALSVAAVHFTGGTRTATLSILRRHWLLLRHAMRGWRPL